jgi:hypothetical protein
MTHRLIGAILGATTGLLLGGQLVIVTDRIDLPDTSSKRARQLDTYDTKSNRTRWGTITRPSGEIDAFDTDGDRPGTGKLPPPERDR